MEGFDGTFDVGEWSFRPVVGNEVPAGPDDIAVFKARHMVELIADHLRSESVSRIVELGTMSGGSTALLGALAPEATILTIDCALGPVPVLERFLAADRRPDRIRAARGVDQADRDALRELAAETFDGAPVDLVIDDASHALAPTRAALDALLPLVRPGGCYLIEDWSWAHLRALPELAERRELRWPQGPSLTAVVFDLVMATACASSVVHRVDLDYSIVRAWRGPGEIDPQGFRLRDLLVGVEPYPGPPGG
jgi:predicted O-methyltransferase YrrM